MILTDSAIYDAWLEGVIHVDQFDRCRLNPNSYNLRLAPEIGAYDMSNGHLDCKRENKLRTVLIPEEGYMLHPGVLYLARTYEYTKTFKHVPMIEGRSSLGRLGIFIHVTAGFGDIGFCGYWTLEISVVQRVIIYPMMEVCQIFYHVPQGQVTQKYKGKYQNADGIQPSGLWKEF